MLLISRPPPAKRAPKAMSIHLIHNESSAVSSRTHVLVDNTSTSPYHPPNQSQEYQHQSPSRRQYIRPALRRIDCSPSPPTPKHWDLTSRVSNLYDVREEDGYILSANGEEYTSGVFVPCEPLTAVSAAAVKRIRPGRLRIRPTVLHRRRISGITTSPISPTTAQQHSSSCLLRDCLPPTPLTPNTDFKNLYNSFRKCDALPATKTASPEVPVPIPPAFPISPPVSPASSGSPSSPRQQRPVLHVQTSSPVGTSAPPPTPALTSPCPSTFQFRPSGRLPKRTPIPVWPTEYPRAVVA